MERIELVKTALQQEGFSVDPELVEKLSSYRELLLDWNRKINLVSRRDEGRIVTRHFLESMGLTTVVRFPPRTRVVDMGSGAGFPGIPLKLIRPDLLVALVESKRKKVFFLEKAVQTLDLTGVEVFLGRMEEVGTAVGPADFVVSRSVADLVSLAAWSRDCLDSRHGKLVAMKGPDVEEELERLRRESDVLGVKKWTLMKYTPFSSTVRLRQSCVVIVEMGG